MSEWLVDQPLRVGPRTLRGRVYLPAHQPGLAEGGRVSERYVAYHARRARSGVAMQITGATPILPSTQWNDICLWNVDDSVIPGYQRLAAAVHDEGGVMLAQLAHPGPTEYEGGDVIGPSWDFSEVSRQIAIPATLEQIEQIIGLYGEASARCAAGDLDGVEISMAHGLLLAAFISPLTNHREDAYGGSLTARLRLPLEVLRATREAIGPDRVLGVRLGIDDLTPGGLTPSTAVDVARLLAPHCDYLSVMVGNNNRLEPRVQHWPPTPAPPGLFRQPARLITQAVEVPVCAVGRVTSASLANEILLAGDADMVGIVRGHIADPDLLIKARHGLDEDVRPCVGANVCVNGLLDGQPLRCLVNPDAGDSAGIEPSDTGAGVEVLVIGAGPAGMEAARRLATAGFTVTLADRAQRLGGQMAAWSAGPSRREFESFVRWMSRQLQQLRVRVVLGRAIDADVVAQAKPDHVVLATGSVSRRCPTCEDDGSVRHVDAITALTEPSTGPVLVADHIGGLDAALVADKLAADGHTVTLATGRLHVGEGEGITTLYPLLRRLAQGGVDVITQRELDHISGRRVHLRGVLGAAPMTVQAATVVSLAGAEPVLSLLEPLAAAGFTPRVIGDAGRPRRVTDAVADARRVVDELIAEATSPQGEGA